MFESCIIGWRHLLQGESSLWILLNGRNCSITKPAISSSERARATAVADTDNNCYTSHHKDDDQDSNTDHRADDDSYNVCRI